MNIAVSKAMDTVYFRLAEYDLLEALDSWSVSNNYLDGPDRKAELLIDLSRLYYYLDEFENMLLYAQQGAELNGASDAKLSALYNQMGVAGWYLRRRNDAIDWFQKAVDYDPQNQLAQKNLDIVSR
jgi:tetratricopeptide (TPR) repeat protein